LTQRARRPGTQTVADPGDQSTGKIDDSPEMGGGSTPVGAVARSATRTVADGEDEPDPSSRAVLAHAPVARVAAAQAAIRSRTAVAELAACRADG